MGRFLACFEKPSYLPGEGVAGFQTKMEEGNRKFIDCDWFVSDVIYTIEVFVREVPMTRDAD